MYNIINTRGRDYEIEIDRDSIVLSCSACPTIYDFDDVDGTSYYFRLRHGGARVVCVDMNKTLVAGTMFEESGSCDWEEAVEWMESEGLYLI